MSLYWKQKPTWRKDLITYNSYPWIMFSFKWLFIIWRGGSSFEIGRIRSRGWKNFERWWKRGVGDLENWTIFIDVIWVSSLSENQSANVNNRFISKVGKLISDILEITDSLQIDGLLMTIDIKTAFDSVNNFFLISVLKRYGFGDDFIKWIKTLLKNQESCFFNGRKTIRYFKHFQQTFSF